jgi:hypothetical protein
MADTITPDPIVETTEPTPLKLNLGSGKTRMPGFLQVDRLPFEEVDVVLDLAEREATGFVPWPWPDGSVSEIHMSHTLEHFTAHERCHIFNEMYRVMEPGAKATIICPHWASQRAYGDPTHCWPPIGSFFYLYLNKAWRDANAPHTDRENLSWGYNCNFDTTTGGSLHQEFLTKSQETQMFAMAFYIESVPDLIATLIKPVGDPLSAKRLEVSR